MSIFLLVPFLSSNVSGTIQLRSVCLVCEHIFGKLPSSTAHRIDAHKCYPLNETFVRSWPL